MGPTAADRAAATYYGGDVYGEIGALTAYCVGYNPSCPGWVNTALSNAWNGKGTTAEAQQLGEPVPAGVEETVEYSVSSEPAFAEDE